jgi:hypothetical protein
MAVNRWRSSQAQRGGRRCRAEPLDMRPSASPTGGLRWNYIIIRIIIIIVIIVIIVNNKIKNESERGEGTGRGEGEEEDGGEHD